MKPALLDTDMVSELLKQHNANVVAHGTKYLQLHAAFAFSAITRYEIRRGYLAKQAVRQLARFDAFCAHSFVMPIDDAVLDRASELWSLARTRGWPRMDADLIIGATALIHNPDLATGNSNHYAWMPGINLTDWRLP